MVIINGKVSVYLWQALSQILEAKGKKIRYCVCLGGAAVHVWRPSVLSVASLSWTQLSEIPH